MRAPLGKVMLPMLITGSITRRKQLEKQPRVIERQELITRIGVTVARQHEPTAAELTATQRIAHVMPATIGRVSNDRVGGPSITRVERHATMRPGAAEHHPRIKVADLCGQSASVDKRMVASAATAGIQAREGVRLRVDRTGRDAHSWGHSKDFLGRVPLARARPFRFGVRRRVVARTKRELR